MKGVSAVIATILMLIITIALAGMAYMYIAGVFTARTQGIEIVDSYCEEGTPDRAHLVIRNIGTTEISVSGITITETAPTAGPAANIVWAGAITTLDPGQSNEVLVDCDGSGGRSCQYRLVPPIGGTVTAMVYCT